MAARKSGTPKATDTTTAATTAAKRQGRDRARPAPAARAKAVPADQPLSELEERFCREYLVDLVAARAYHRARPDVTEPSAHTLGAAMLQQANVARRVAELQAERAARTEVTADRVVRELARVAFADQRTYAQWGPMGVTLKDSATLTEDDAAAVAEVSQSITQGGGSIKCKLHDKVGALTLLGKHLGMFTDKVEHSGVLTVRYEDA